MSPRFAPQSLVGSWLGETGRRVCVRQWLASGGIAYVYLASAEADPERLLALKLLNPDLGRNAEKRARFEREALAASRIQHENVLHVLEPAQRWHELSYFCSEHLVGVDLAEHLGARGRVAAPRAARLLLAAARGLEAAHAAGVVHRDVKPENLFLVHQPDGREVLKVLDFGSAWIDSDGSSGKVRITAIRTFTGTPGYMAPEQAEWAVGHATADVYSLGVVAFETIAGRPPFSSNSWQELLHLHATEGVPALHGASPALEAVVHRAMSKQPSARYSSMSELARELALVPELASG